MDASKLMTMLRASRQVRIEPPAGMPQGPLPRELHEFYRRCGGLTIHVGSPHGVRILHPDEIEPSNPVISQESTTSGDRSDHWFVIAVTSHGDYLVIDADPARRGRIHDGHFETYRLVGDMPVIALSLSDLCLRLAQSEPDGGQYYWMRPGWEPLGDAYDEAASRVTRARH